MSKYTDTSAHLFLGEHGTDHMCVPTVKLTDQGFVDPLHGSLNPLAEGAKIQQRGFTPSVRTLKLCLSAASL